MADTVIPPLPPGFTLDSAAPAVPPLPPGFTLDAAPTAGTGSTELVGTTPAQGDQPARVVIGTNPQPSFLHNVAENLNPVNAIPNAVDALVNGRHSLQVGAQGVGAGVRDIALMPFDLAAGAQNLVTSGINKVFGTEIPPATPASQLADKVTGPFAIPEDQMSPNERLGYNISRFGTQGLGMGSMLAARAPAVAEAAAPAASFLGRTLDSLARPYTAAPAKTVLGDTVSGAGSGAAVNAAHEYLPQEPVTPAGRVMKNVADFVAPLAGGIGASGIQHAVEGTGGLFRRLGQTRADVNVPLNSKGAPFSVAQTNAAAEALQSKTTGAPRAVAQDIRENAADLTNPTRAGETPVEQSQLPTTGLLSRDPGLVRAETGARTKDNGAFVQRDQNVKEAAATRVDSLRDPNADQGAVPRAAADARESQMAPLEQRVQQFADINNRANAARQQQGAEFGAVANSEAKANASRNLDRAVVDQNYIPARAEKNRQFDEAPGRAEQLPADPVFEAIDAVRAGINRLGPNNQMPAEFVERLDRLRPRMVEDPPNSGTMVNHGGPGTALGGDLADLRKYLNTAQQTAQRGGNFDLADNIGRLRQAINRTIETAPGYAEANANYAQFAGRFRPEPNDEGAKFTREIDRGGQQPDGTLNRGSTPPTETAGRFLSSPEKSQALNRVLTGAPSEQAGQAAVRDYMRSDFATSALNADGTINPARASAWARNNSDVLAQFPALRTEFDGIVRGAQRGEQLSNDARSFLDQARRTAKATEADLDRGAIGTLLREDPRDVAKGLLNGGYGAEKRLDEINALVKNDPEAARGWKSAVSEVLTDRVTSTRKVGETPEVQYARLAKEFKDNEALLAKVYTPEEMNTLRQGHKLLEYFKEAEKRPTSGSATAERSVLWRTGELALRHVYGDLKGGGIIRRMKLLADLLPNNKASLDELTNMAWFNPNVAAYLLEKKIADPNVYHLSINLRRLIAADNSARESGKN